MSASLSNINSSDYLFFSAKTAQGCAGKPVKIHKNLAVAFIAAVDPKSHEGKALIAGIEQLTALAQDTQAQTHANNAAVKLKAVGNITLCYVVTQAQGDRTPTVYITNFRQKFKSDEVFSGLYSIERGSRYEKTTTTKTAALTSRKLFICGLASRFSDALDSGFARFAASKFDLFYTSGDDLAKMGAWSLPVATDTSSALAKALNAYSGKEIVQVYAEGYGAHVLHSALPSIQDLSRFSFAIENPVTNIAALIASIDSKNGKYISQDVVSIYPGHTFLPEFNASKVALAYSRLALVQKVRPSRSWNTYSKVLTQLYQNINGVPANRLEDGINVEDPRTGRNLSVSYSASFNVNNFVELINRVFVSR